MEKNSLKLQAYQIIKNKILSCEFPPGMLLNENLLCDMLSISRTPVKDAISRLEQERFVRIFPPKGVLVEPITITEVSTFFEARLLFEPYLVKEYGKDIKEQEFQGFEDFFNTLSNLADARKFYETVSAFHGIFYERSFNPYLIQSYGQLKGQELRILSLIRLQPSQITPLPSLYLRLIGFCQKGSWEEAAEAMREVLRVCRDIIFADFLDYLKRKENGGEQL